MISMVEKIIRLHISGCNSQLTAMRAELAAHREKFLSCPEILDFEKEWMEQFVHL